MAHVSRFAMLDPIKIHHKKKTVVGYEFVATKKKKIEWLCIAVFGSRQRKCETPVRLWNIPLSFFFFSCLVDKREQRTKNTQQMQFAKYYIVAKMTANEIMNIYCVQTAIHQIMQPKLIKKYRNKMGVIDFKGRLKIREKLFFISWVIIIEVCGYMFIHFIYSVLLSYRQIVNPSTRQHSSISSQFIIWIFIYIFISFETLWD